MKQGIPYKWNNHVLTYSERATDSSDSIPLGNGDIGINLWIENEGDLLFYIAKSDAFSEHNQLLKLGRIRMSLTPNPFSGNQPYKLELDCSTGIATATAGDLMIEIWVDAFSPNIMVKMNRKSKFSYTVTLENWRQRPRTLFTQHRSPWDFFEIRGVTDRANIAEPFITLEPDRFFDETTALLWAHCNPEITVWDDSVRITGCDEFKALVYNPLANRITGARVSSDDLTRVDMFTLTAKKPIQQSQLSVTLLSEQTTDLEGWKERIRKLKADPQVYPGSIDKHAAWWQERMDRHWMKMSGSPVAEYVGMCYELQRYMNLCAGRGIGPIHFNGSLFNVDWYVMHDTGKTETYNADYRRWGNTHVMQNSRWAYWGMLTCGDFEFMKPLFRWYENILPAARKKCEIYYGHPGTIITDNMSLWGAPPAGSFRAFKTPGECYRNWQNSYFSPALEFIMLGLDYCEFSNDEALLNDLILPVWEGVALLYNNHFELDENGKLIIRGASLEQYHETVNPLPCVAGLTMISERILKLPNLPDKIRSLTKTIKEKVPATPLCPVSTVFPVMEARIEQAWAPLGVPLDPPPQYGEDDETRIAPAEKLLSDGWNVENPELYAVFPYRVHCLANGDVDLAKRTFLNRRFTHDWGWAQDPIQAAMCGLTDEAKTHVETRYSRKLPAASFPAFWDIGFDWAPDQDNGGVANKALQSMLIQYHDEKILLFPAWPKEWNISFKMYAPYQTRIEGLFEDGQLKELNVFPPHRKKDVINCLNTEM